MADLSMYKTWLSPRGAKALRRDDNLGKELAAQWKGEQVDRAAAKRLIEWYNRSRAKIVEYIQKQATITFGDETKEWQCPTVNGVKRTIKRISMTYRTPPTRRYFIGEKELKTGDKELAKVERMYKRLDRNRRLRQAEQFGNLLNTVHVEVVYRNNRIDWDIRKRTEVMVVPDPADYLRFLGFARRLDFMINDKPLGGFLLWTDAEYVFVRDDGFVYAVGDSAGLNPFAGETLIDAERPIPIVTIRREECEDYWGRYGSDIVDAFEQAAIQLGNLWENGFLQTHGQPVAINMKLKKGERLKVGPKHPITVEGVMKDDASPSLTFPSPEPKIVEMQALIDWFIKLNAGSYGQPPSAWAQDEKAMSGFAKMIDNSELLEDRDDQLNDWIQREVDLHEYTKLTWNRYHPIEAEHVDPLVRLEVTFNEVEFPESPQEEASAAAIEIENNFSSPVDWIMKKRKISDRKEALKLALEIVKENAAIKKAQAEAFGVPEEAPPPGRGPVQPREEGTA
jgi:hypothetical protein